MDHLSVSWMVEYPSTESRWIVRTEKRGNERLMDGRNGECEFLCCSDFSDGHLGRGDESPAVWERTKREEKKTEMDRGGWFCSK